MTDIWKMLPGSGSKFAGFPRLQLELLNVPGPAKEAEPMESMESQQLTVSSVAGK